MQAWGFKAVNLSNTPQPAAAAIENPTGITPAQPWPKPPAPAPAAGESENYARQTSTAGFIKKMAISDGKLIKITNDKKELLQPHTQISVPDSYKLVEAAFVLPIPTDPFPNSLLVKLTKPGSFEQPSVLVNLTYSRLPSDHKLVMRLWCVSSGA